MPVIEDISANEHTRVMVWFINEPEAELKAQLQLSAEELTHLESIRVEQKRLQWLASRILIRIMVDSPKFILMHKTNNGQPVLTELGYHVSISHCGNYAAVILSKTSRVGIDVEEITDRVLSIRHKFIGEQEMMWLFNEKDTMRTLLVWSAKETIYKWHAKGQVDFRRNIFLENFDLSQNGIISAVFRKAEETRPLLVNYRCYPDFVLTWLID